MLTACLIGVSGFGDRHYRDLLAEVERGDMRIIGATVINQDQEADKCARLRALGCELFTDHRAMFARLHGRIDLCCIPTGIHLHMPMTIDALRAGANVLVEKPAAAAIQEVRAMQAAERASGRFVAVGFQSIFARDTLTMKRAILDGAPGRVRSIVCRGLWPRSEAYYTRNGWAGRLRDRAHWVLDSPFNNALAHQLNLLLFLAGGSERESAVPASVTAELYRANRIESADTVAMRIVTADGLPLLFLATHACAQRLGPEIEVRGDRGSIHWTFTETRIARHQAPIEIIANQSEEEVRRAMFAQLRARIADPSRFVCGLDIAAAHTLAVNGAHESSAVHEIDPALVQRVVEGDATFAAIIGIDTVIARCFAEERLFCEIGAPWAVPGRTVAMDGYQRFPQRSALAALEAGASA